MSSAQAYSSFTKDSVARLLSCLVGVRESARPLLKLYDDLLGASDKTVAEAEKERPSIRKIFLGGVRQEHVELKVDGPHLRGGSPPAGSLSYAYWKLYGTRPDVYIRSSQRPDIKVGDALPEGPTQWVALLRRLLQVIDEAVKVARSKGLEVEEPSPKDVDLLSSPEALPKLVADLFNALMKCAPEFNEDSDLLWGLRLTVKEDVDSIKAANPASAEALELLGLGKVDEVRGKDRTFEFYGFDFPNWEYVRDVIKNRVNAPAPESTNNYNVHVRFDFRNLLIRCEVFISGRAYSCEKTSVSNRQLWLYRHHVLADAIYYMDSSLPLPKTLGGLIIMAILLMSRLATYIYVNLNGDNYGRIVRVNMPDGQFSYLGCEGTWTTVYDPIAEDLGQIDNEEAFFNLNEFSRKHVMRCYIPMAVGDIMSQKFPELSEAHRNHLLLWAIPSIISEEDH